MTVPHLVKEPDPQADRARLFAKAGEISADLTRRGAQLDAEGKPPLEDFLPIERIPPRRRGEAFTEASVECRLHLVGVTRCKGTYIALDAGTPGNERTGKPARPEADGGVLMRLAVNLAVFHPLSWGDIEAS